jgi:tol-pal system protein YbgF
MTYRFAFTVAIAALLPALATAQTPARPPVTDMSTRAPGAGTAAPGGGAGAADTAAMRKIMADLTLELDQLRTQLRELRGQYETQAHELESLKSRNREALSDTDKRLRELERKATPATGTAPDAPAPKEAAAPVATAATAGVQQEYDAAFGLMKQGMYERAAKSFREFIAKHPSSELAGNAQYWVGEAQYVVRNFKSALEEFTRVVDKYPNSPKLPDALLKIGYVQHELGNLDKARQSLQQVVSRYPNTTSAKSAEKRLADIKAAEAKKAPEPKKAAVEPKKTADTKAKKQ